MVPHVLLAIVDDPCTRLLIAAHSGAIRRARGAVVVKQQDPEAERAWDHIVISALGAVVTAAVLVALYFLLPLDDLSGASAVSGLVVGIVVFVALITWQVWRILRSDHPGSRALEGLFVAVPLVILMFATTYYLMGRAPTPCTSR